MGSEYGAKRIVILGAGAAARMCAYILGLDEAVEVVGFTDNDDSRRGELISGLPILGPDEQLSQLYEEGVHHAVIGVGDPDLRYRLRLLVEELGFKLTGAVHPTAVIAPDVDIAENAIVLPGAILADNPVIGSNVFVGQGVVVGHGANVASDCLVGGRSAIGADVTIEERALIGWGAVIGPSCKVGKGAAVATGATVVSDVPENAVVVGNPAKVVKYRN